MGALHLTYGETERALADLARGRKWNEPARQMNKYDLPRLCQIFGNPSAFLAFKKAARDQASP